jgi:hypothetical protein
MDIVELQGVGNHATHPALMRYTDTDRPSGRASNRDGKTAVIHLGS